MNKKNARRVSGHFSLRMKVALAIAEAIDHTTGDGEELTQLRAEVFKHKIRRDADGPTCRTVEIDAATYDTVERGAVGVQAGGVEERIRRYTGITVVKVATACAGQRVEVNTRTLISNPVILRTTHVDHLRDEWTCLNLRVSGLCCGQNRSGAAIPANVGCSAPFWRKPVGAHHFAASHVVALGDVLAGLAVQKVEPTKDFVLFGVGDWRWWTEGVLSPRGGGCGKSAEGSKSSNDNVTGRHQGRPGRTPPGTGNKHVPPLQAAPRRFRAIVRRRCGTAPIQDIPIAVLPASAITPDTPDLCDNGLDQVTPLRGLLSEVSAMLNDLFQPMHLLIIGLIVVVFFGGKKLPELGKGLGEGLKGFKEGLKGVTDDVKTDAHIVTPEPKEPATKS